MLTSDEIDDIAETHGWRSAEEREAALAETAARQKRIDYDAAVALACSKRLNESSGPNSKNGIGEPQNAPRPSRRTSQNGKRKCPASNTEGWQDWISGEIKAQQKAARSRCSRPSAT